jgi:hypothetical protein
MSPLDCEEVKRAGERREARVPRDGRGRPGKAINTEQVRIEKHSGAGELFRA